MSDHDLPLNDFLAALHKIAHGDLERRYCTVEEPMPMDDKKLYMWGHPDAVFVEHYFNLSMYKCPHCKLVFTCFPPGVK